MIDYFMEKLLGEPRKNRVSWPFVLRFCFYGGGIIQLSKVNRKPPYAVLGCHLQLYTAMKYLENASLEPGYSTFVWPVVKNLNARVIDSVTKRTHPSVLRELWHSWSRNKAHNWTVKETEHWLTSYSKLPEYEYLPQKENISGSFFPRIFQPNCLEAHNFNNVNSFHSGLTNQLWNISVFGPPERSPSVYLIVGVLILFGLWFTSMLTICFVRILLKPGKSTLKHDGLSKSRKILQALEKSLSHQVETYDLKSLNVISSYNNNDNSDHSNTNFNSCRKLNWDKVNEILGQSKINMFFPNTQLSALVSLLRESYIIETKYLLEKISGTAQKLSVAEDLYVKSQTKKCLLIFPCYSKKCIDKEFYIVMNRVKNKVSDLKHEVITHNRRWRCILAALHNSCNGFAGFNNVNFISTSSASFKTTFECKKSENSEQVQSFVKDTCDNKNESHEKLASFSTEFFENKNKFISPGENESVIGMCSINDDFPGDSKNISNNDVPDSYCNNPQMVDANKRNYSNLHSTKIPTFIHLSLSSQKTSRKWKSGSVQKKHISQHVYGNRLSALSTTKRSGNISHNGKLRIPFEDFTNTTDPTTGIRKPEPIKF
ncbi:unnamed protein product [Schistosoma spindalis]|nr:unnamed protein product [Schistosoma spindale]